MMMTMSMISMVMMMLIIVMMMSGCCYCVDEEEDEDAYLPTEFIQSSPHDEDVVQEASIAIA